MGGGLAIDRRLLISSYYGLFVFGFFLTITGPALPSLTEDVGLTFAAAGSLYTLRGFGILAAGLAGGMLADVVGRRFVIVLGASLWSLGLVVFALASVPLVVLGIWVVIGLGAGAVDVGLNTLVSDISGQKASALSRLHFWFGIGAISGPIAAQFVLEYWPWRILFGLNALMILPFVLHMALREYPPQRCPLQPPWRNLGSVLTLPVLLLGVIVFGYMGVGTTFLGWINIYLLSHWGVGAWIASLALTVYSIGLAAGRLVLSLLSDRLRYEWLLLLAACLSLLFATVALMTTNLVTAIAAFALTGFCLAALLPSSLALATRRYRQYAGTAAGVLMTFGSLGRTILPGMSGYLAEVRSVGYGLRWMLVVILAAGLSAALLLYWEQICQRQKASGLKCLAGE